MRHPGRFRLLPALLLAGVLSGGGARAENIDPGGNASQFAYGENVGWINAEPLGDGGPGLQVDDFALSGWLWGENTGWISLSCENTSSCDDVDYGVRHDGNGVLVGHAWAESLGWISFSCGNTSSCAAESYGATIDPTSGQFGGRAWAENAGWITLASVGGAVPYGIRTVWSCDPPPEVPAGIVSLEVDRSGSDAWLTWSGPAQSTGYDVLRGELGALRATGGNYPSSMLVCLHNDLPAASRPAAGAPATGEGFWFLVRGVNCGGSGSYGPGVPGPDSSRDAQIDAAATACP